MKAHDIIIGSLVIGLDSAHELSQSYEEIGGVTLHRMLNGAALQQSHWRKLKTVITGKGRIPDGFSAIDYDSTVSISCMAPRSISKATNSITIPASRRTDWLPAGYAIVDGRTIASPVSVTSNVATITTVSGATGYQVIYYPVLTCYAKPPTTDFSGRGTVASWRFEAEEA